MNTKNKRWMELQKPSRGAPASVEQAISARRSIRDFANTPLELAHVSHLLLAAQGITQSGVYRSAPSAGALYPLEIYLVSGNIEALPAGIYKYGCQRHGLWEHSKSDSRNDLAIAAHEQSWIANAPAILVIAAVYSRTSAKYGVRGHRYVHMEAGHVAQNIYLQSAALGLGTTTVGAFQDARIKAIIDMPDQEEPLSLLPIGRSIVG